MLWKFIVLFIARWHKEKIIKKILLFIREHDLPIKEKAMQNAIDDQINTLELGLNTIKTIASIAPLLGLLGTVIGVLGAFDAVSQQGLGDPTVFSSGISVALITTVAGLIVAIPHYIGYNYFIALLANIEIGLEKEVLEQL